MMNDDSNQLMATEKLVEEDAFWSIALSFEQLHVDITAGDDNDDDDEEGEGEGCSDRGSTAIYRLQNPPVELHLSSLPEASGAWSPLGAQIWHASAVLACLPFKFDQVNTVLEIGSGAVGLSGLALAVRMKEQSKTMIVSDVKDDGILSQLQSNVDVNISKLSTDDISVAQVLVADLDWRETTAIDSLPPLDLIVGSELVYTDETSNACASLIKNLLAKNAQARVAIVQVFDRPGWSEFLTLLSGKTIDIIQPLPIEWHDRASQMLGREALGTLSREDYGLCLIGNLGADVDCVLLSDI